MDMLLLYWPIIAFMSGLFFCSLGVAIGLTLWIMGKLSEQDAKRIEVKESILKEVREVARAMTALLEQKYLIADAKIDNAQEDISRLGNRITWLEAKANGHPRAG